MILLGRDPRATLQQLARSRLEEITYAEVGATRARTLPAGYHHDSRFIAVGVGETAWLRARSAITLWKAHAGAGITVTPADAAIREGETVLASRALGPVMIVAPCRIVYVTDEPGRFGFAYGTLPGHPEQGEEAFHVTLGDDGTVKAEIFAFSRPADRLAKVAGPVARTVQAAAIKRYLSGIRDHVTGPT